MRSPVPEVHWSSYAWLGYLIFFLMTPVFGASSWSLTLAGVAVFLPIYFWTFRLHGWRVLWGIAGIVLIGVVYAPINAGASTFFVYAGAFAPHVGSPRRAWGVLASLLAVVAVVAFTVQPHPWFWIPAGMCTLLVGGSVIHVRELAQTNARLSLSQQEVSRLARIAERERIARDLHDLLGHTLSVITLKSELAAKLTDRDPQRAAEEIRDVERISRKALKEVRSAVAGYRAETLMSEVANARSALEAAGVDLDCGSEPPELAPLHESVLALALREAVTNVIRHARARRCRIAFEKDDSDVRLEVEDDGGGSDAPEGAGLAGMRERVASLGGRVERDVGVRPEGRGTRLVVSLPILADGRQLQPLEAAT